MCVCVCLCPAGRLASLFLSQLYNEVMAMIVSVRRGNVWRDSGVAVCVMSAVCMPILRPGSLVPVVGDGVCHL